MDGSRNKGVPGGTRAVGFGHDGAHAGNHVGTGTSIGGGISRSTNAGPHNVSFH
jgi:hypothetical protein